MNVGTVTIFYINAQSDEILKRNLESHLQKYKGYIDHRSEQTMPPGSTLKNEIEVYARKADILLLLVSPDLPDIDPTIRSIVVERQQAGQLRIIPIYLRPFNWHDPVFSLLRSLPSDGVAVTERRDRDSVFREIATEILGEVEKILKERYKKLAETYRANGKYEESLTACKRAISFAQERDASLYQFQGDLYTQNKQLKEALEAYDRAIGLESPPSPTLLEKKGLTLFALGSYETAVRTYREALGHIAGNTSLSRNLGEAHYVLRQFEQARQAYKQAIDQDRENAHLYARVGDTFLETPDAKQSLHWYDQAIALQPSNDSFYEKKGDALMRISNYKDALDAYENAIMRNAENAAYFISKARALESLGTKQADCAPISFEKAVEAYEQALRLRPESYHTLKELGDVLFKLHRLEEALNAYEEAIRYKSDFGLAYLGKGKVLQQQASDLEKLSQEAYSKAERLGFPNEHFSQE